MRGGMVRAGAGMKLDGFAIAMAVAIALAAWAPKLGAEHGILHVSLVTQVGITLLFFLHGACLSREALQAGASNWRLHLLVQATTFVLFPVLGAACYAVSKQFISDDWGLGLFYLCVLSSTISSSVAMTAMARGDIPAAVFNATLSGALGMVLTPLLIGAVDATDRSISMSGAMTTILLKLFAPFATGQLVRPWIATVLDAHKRWLSTLDRTVILFIVYGAFCESTVAGVWSQFGLLALLAVFAAVALLLLLALLFILTAARRLRFTVEQEIAALFCGSQKSLANGAPMAKILFGAHPALAMIMLPLLMYHQLQLIVCSVLSRRYAAR